MKTNLKSNNCERIKLKKMMKKKEKKIKKVSCHPPTLLDVLGNTPNNVQEL
jgi:hypothetical protein